MVRLDTSEITDDSDVPDLAIEDGITTGYVVWGCSWRASRCGMAGISIFAGLSVIAAIQETGIVVMGYGLSEDVGL